MEGLGYGIVLGAGAVSVLIELYFTQESTVQI